MDCPHCKASLDDDSAFCDQCGAEILRCSQCGRPGKGKRCIHDGKPLVSAASAPGAPGPVAAPAVSVTTPLPAPSAAPAPTAQPPGPLPMPAAPPSAHPATAGAPAATVPVSAAMRLRLHCAQHGIDFRPEPGAVLGRRAGNHAALFASLAQISGKHAEIQQPAPGQWTVTDLGSTNGTRVNGAKLTPQTPQALNPGAVLTLADVAFNVSLEPAP